MNYNSPGSSVQGILQARILEWGVIAFSPISTGGAKMLLLPKRFWASLAAQLVKHPLAMQETLALVQFLGQEDPLEKG